MDSKEGVCCDWWMSLTINKEIRNEYRYKNNNNRNRNGGADAVSSVECTEPDPGDGNIHEHRDCYSWYAGVGNFHE